MWSELGSGKHSKHSPHTHTHTQAVLKSKHCTLQKYPANEVQNTSTKCHTGSFCQKRNQSLSDIYPRQLVGRVFASFSLLQRVQDLGGWDVPFGLCRVGKMQWEGNINHSPVCLNQMPFKTLFLDILNIICSWLIAAWMKDPPADLVLSRVGSLSLWISPSPPWMSPARSWRIGEGHLQRKRKRRKMGCHFFSVCRVSSVFY